MFSKTAHLSSAVEVGSAKNGTTRSWLNVSDIFAHVGIPDSQWNAAIKDLRARCILERQGESRCARYRISESY